tara:strand:+ start:15466 stop:15861 length:396 start_codon:yes stop_codon:yes gene_type:complete
MWLRGATSSLIVSFLFSLGYRFYLTKDLSNLLDGQLGYLFLFMFFSTYVACMVIVYGRQIKYRIKREKGTIKWFDPSKGYGFLERDKGGDLFIHFASVSEQDRKQLKENTRVSYIVTEGTKGPQANQIRII